jgi:hypothetical protein
MDNNGTTNMLKTVETRNRNMRLWFCFKRRRDNSKDAFCRGRQSHFANQERNTPKEAGTQKQHETIVFKYWLSNE